MRDPAPMHRLITGKHSIHYLPINRRASDQCALATHGDPHSDSRLFRRQIYAPCTLNANVWSTLRCRSTPARGPVRIPHFRHSFRRLLSSISSFIPDNPHLILVIDLIASLQLQTVIWETINLVYISLRYIMTPGNIILLTG